MALLLNNFHCGEREFNYPPIVLCVKGHITYIKSVLRQFCHSPFTDELAYQKIVNGKTFGADTQLIEQLEKKLTNVKLVENTLDHKITILFCPISSRIGADVTAAMNEVKGKENYNTPKPFFVCFLPIIVLICERS